MIKSEVYKSNRTEYPAIKEFVYENRRKIVLFTCPGNGIVLHSDFPEEYIGYLSTKWNEDKFRPFYGDLKIIVQ